MVFGHRYFSAEKFRDPGSASSRLRLTKRAPHILCSRQESNLQRLLRREAFYPLNYGSSFGLIEDT